MVDEIINVIEHVLEKEDSYLLPVKRLWYILRKKPQYRNINLEQLEEMLSNDSRCKLYDIRDKIPDVSSPWSKDKEPEMERLGFFLGPRVMLLSRPLTKDSLQHSITRTIDNMQNVLRKAYDLSYANEDLEDYEGEKQLLEIMAKTRDLRTKVDKALDSEKMKGRPDTEEN